MNVLVNNDNIGVLQMIIHTYRAYCTADDVDIDALELAKEAASNDAY